MTNQEFSDTFTTLLNSNSEVAQFGDQDAPRDINLTEYEKSVFLSLAEEDILKSYFNRNLNPHDQGFDDTERRQIEYSSLVKVVDLKPLEEKKSLQTDNQTEPTRRLLQSTILLEASGDVLPQGIETNSDGSINVVLQTFMPTRLVRGFNFDSRSREEQDFTTGDKDYAIWLNNVLWSAKQLVEQNNLDGPVYYLDPGYSRLIKIVNLNAFANFIYNDINDSTISIPYSFRGVICADENDAGFDGLIVNILGCDYGGGHRLDKALAHYEQPTSSYPAYVGYSTDKYYEQHPEAKHGYYWVDTASIYFDKSTAGYNSSDDSHKYIVYQIYTGYGSVGFIDFYTDANWLTLTYKKEPSTNRTAYHVELDTKNGTNNTGQVRKAVIDVVWSYYNQDGTTTTVTEKVYVYQGTKDNLSPDLGFVVTPAIMNMAGKAPYDPDEYSPYTSEFANSFSVNYYAGCTYTVELVNPEDAWIHFKKSTHQIDVACDANTTGSEREGKLAVTVTSEDGTKSITKYVTVVQPVTDVTSPPNISIYPQSDYIVLGSEANNSYSLEVATSNTTKKYLCDISETDVSWLIVQNRDSGKYNGTITLTTRTENNSYLSRKTTFRLEVTGNGHTVEKFITVEQLPGSEEEPKISVEPTMLTFKADYNAGNVEKYDVQINASSGSFWNYEVKNNPDDFFDVKAQESKLVVSLKKTNTKTTQRIGSFLVFLTDSSGKALDKNNPAYCVAVQVVQVAAEQSGGSSGESGTTSLPPTLSISPTNITVGVNGTRVIFTKYWYSNGEISKPQYDYGKDNEPEWFGILFEKDEISGAPSYPSTYNQLGAVLICQANNTTNVREGTATVIVKNLKGVYEQVVIKVTQEAAESETPSEEKPYPIITCTDPITIPSAANGDTVQFPFHITLENTTDYYITFNQNDGIIESVQKYDGGDIVIYCKKNTSDTQRYSSITIIAENDWHQARKLVGIIQEASGGSATADSYLFVTPSSVLIKSEPEEGNTFTIKADTNLDSIAYNLFYQDSSGDDWLNDVTPGEPGEEQFGKYVFSCISPNLSSEDRFATIRIYYDMGGEDIFSQDVTIRQLAKPSITFTTPKYDNFNYSGGELTVPFKAVGIVASTLKVTNPNFGYANHILASQAINISISENQSLQKRQLQFTLEGENELGEKAAATVFIIQNSAPIYSGDDDPSGGSSGDGGDSGSSGSQTPEYDDQTYAISKFDDRSLVFRLPRRTVSGKEQVGTTDVLFILNEKLIVPSETKGKSTTDYTIKPISYLEYDRIMSRAYNYPMKRQAWRLFQNQTTGFDIISEIIPANAAASVEGIVYRLRYVRRPKPIVLTDLPDGLTIDGYNTVTTCELNPMLHMDVVVRAVQLALASRSRQFVASNNEQK